MKKTWALFFSLLLIFSITACKKDGTGETPTPTTPIGNTLKSNSFIVSDNSFINLTDNSVTIIKASASISPKVGDILLAQPSQNAPYGFLRKVTNITETATQVVCTTEQAGLNEAFEQLDIDTTYTDKFTSTTAYKDGASMEFSFSNNGTLIPGMKLNGVLQLNMPSVKFEYVKKKNSLMPEKVVFLTEINTEGSSLEVLHADNVAIQFSEQTLKTIALPTIKVIIPITTPIGIFLLPVPFTQKLELRWKPLTISGKVKWEFKPILTATFGAKYENGNWENLSGFSFNGTADSLYQQFFPVNAGLNASFTFINPVYEISPYNSDALKAFVSIPHTLDFTLQPPAITPNYSLKYQAKITGGIKSKLWLGKENEYTISFNLPEKKLKEGNWAADTASILVNHGTWKATEGVFDNVRLGDYGPSEEYESDPICGLLTGAWALDEVSLVFGNDAAANMSYIGRFRGDSVLTSDPCKIEVRERYDSESIGFKWTYLPGLKKIRATSTTDDGFFDMSKGEYFDFTILSFSESGMEITGTPPDYGVITLKLK